MRQLETSKRSWFFARAGQVAATATLTIMIAGGCGGVNSSGGDAAAGTSGQGGNAGGGAGGTAGSGGGSAGRGGGGGFAGSTGGSAGGDGCGPGYPVGSSRPAGDGCNVCSCIGPGTWVCSTAACPIGGRGGSGVAGSTGTAGSTGSGGGGSTGAGGIGGGGTTGSAGRGGSTGGGGAGGTSSPCQAVLALERSCTTPADCFAGMHVSNCCGQVQFIGFANSTKTQFQALEAQCDAIYPACGCAAGQPTADDGSRLRFDQQAGVTCLQGKCTTFVPDCGQPCGAGTTCFSCASKPTMFAACTTTCTDSSACPDPTLPLCQMGSSGNVSGKYCTANVACDIK